MESFLLCLARNRNYWNEATKHATLNTEPPSSFPACGLAGRHSNTFIPDMSNVELSPKLKTTFLKGKFWEFNKGLVLLELEQLESEETRAGLDDEIAG